MSKKNWPADKVERRKIADLIPYARNSRIHSDSQISEIAASMNEWGWTNPVLVDETGMIIAGHGRVLAARKLGLTEAPVMVATGWSEAQKRAYVIADNNLALKADWDRDILSKELSALADDFGFDVYLTGFSLDDETSESLAVWEVDSSPVKDRFWISVRGPLAMQAAALQALKSMMAQIPGVDVELGTVTLD